MTPPTITTVPAELLHAALSTAANAAEYYLTNPDIKEILVGWQYSRTEPEKFIASQPRNLHLQIIGYTAKDLAQQIPYSEVRRRPELRVVESEPRAQLITTILQHEVFASLENTPEFQALFTRVSDGDRVTYALVQGINTLMNPELPDILHRIHADSQRAYNDIARCFFTEVNAADHTFAESADGRYQLLPLENRQQRIEDYLARHPYLQPQEQAELRKLALSVRPMSEVIRLLEARRKAPLSTSEKGKFNPCMAIKGLAYAAVFSGIRDDQGTVAWQFGFDPVVFANRSILQAHRGTPGFAARDPNQSLPPAVYAAIRADEQKMVEYLRRKNRVS